MSLSPGTRLGPYDILAPLGAGGMGEVYRATDTRLKRQVAVKILSPALAADPDRLARFQREAEVLASLNHSHIAAVYGLEGADGMKALVMELVEGPTLADRIAEGPIPIGEALPIATQIAEALEAAHEQGIIHRDLKPANIKVRDDGAVKVLDFGLAKLTEAGRARGADSLESPTLTSPAAMTGMGMILGTAAYMSPEQARGRAVDKRTDVWAFGAVLYEMLTGTRAFEASKGDGESVSDLIAAVLTSTPNWAALPTDVPPHVVTLIQRCLEKDRNTRVGDIAVARFLLAGHATLSASPAATPVPRAGESAWLWTPPLVLAAVLVGVLAGTLAGWFVPRRSAAAPAVTRLQMSVSPADSLRGAITAGWIRPSHTVMVPSPDGRLVVFSGTRGNVTQLYGRSLERAGATPIPGTENAFGPFFSPDGEWIGFFADAVIKKVPVAGGPPTTISDVPGRGAGASWGEDGSIAYAVFAGDAGIFTVSSDGGPSTKVVTPDPSTGERLLLPQWLPGEKALLFTVIASTEWDTASIVVQPREGGERRVVVPGGADARYVGTGHLLFVKSGTLNAVAFDARSQHVTGAAVPLIEDVMQSVNASNSSDETGAGQFAVSASGTLLYVLGGINPSRQNSIEWVDRKGGVERLTAIPAASYLGPRLSPDGQRVAVAVRRGTSRGADVWVYDVMRGAPTRLTFDGASSFPVWSPDGKRILYRTEANGVNGLYITNADGGGTPERVVLGDNVQFPSSWASTTNTIAFAQRPQSSSHGVWGLPMAGDHPSKPQLFLESRFSLWHPELSRDGRWMAYVSDESGGNEVYVQPYPGPGEKTRISTAGGFDPLWTSNGRELLYRAFTPDRQQVFSATIRSLSPFQADTPRLLFEAKADEYEATLPDRSWDVSADGQRFLMQRFIPSTDAPITTINVVLNWTEELKRLAPAK